MPIPSDVIDGGHGASRHPGKLNVKTGLPLLDILISSILLFVVFFSSLDIHDIQRFTIIS